MPWSPQDDVEVSDPRLDPYRDRGGVLLDADGAKVGCVFLRAETHWSRTSGHLWWSTWTPATEGVRCHVHRGGRTTDRLSTGPQLDADLADWAAGTFTVGTTVGSPADQRASGPSTTYSVRWLDDEESARARDEVFGLE